MAGQSGKESGDGTTQKFVPPEQICEHLHAIHAYAHNPKRQAPAHHFCAHARDDIRQCLLYDSDKPDARLIGIEYLINEESFNKLPDDEKRYWHSHVYEIKSGMLVMPKPPRVSQEEWETGENAGLEKLVTWYGKVYHLWQTDLGHSLPIGPPLLMTSVTNSELEQEGLIETRDKEWGIDREHKRKIREHFAEPVIHPLADKAPEVVAENRSS